jgi:hypothetical protein
MGVIRKEAVPFFVASELQLYDTDFTADEERR